MKPTILLVDDDEQFRSMIEERIHDELDTIILISENGKEALQLFCSGSIDLVITDTNMPVMNGIELLAAIRESYSQTPVIVLFSGLQGAAIDTSDVYRYGASSVMTKVEAVVNLVDTVRNLLQRVEEKN
jgi:DNA-binding response OmpR family regulator